MKAPYESAAVIYTRVSTDEQAEHGTSLAEQRAVCTRKAEEIGTRVIAHHEDAGVSGGLYESRTGIQDAIGDIESGKANILIVANISRFSRDGEHQQTIRKRIERAGGRIVFCDFNYDPTPEGNLMLHMTGGFAEYERQVIRKRTMVGRRRRAEEGQQPTRSTPPYGYHIVTKADVLRGAYSAHELGHYILMAEEAEVVAKIFQWCASGRSIREICRLLNQRGIVTKKGGKTWRPATVGRILKNPVYRGEPRFGVRETVHDESRLKKGFRQPHFVRIRAQEEWVRLSAPRIVEANLWEECQRRVAEAAETGRGRPASAPRLLAKLIRCPKCRKMMTGQKKTRKLASGNTASEVWYHCPANRPSQTIDGHVCHKPTYSERRVDNLVLKGVREALNHPDLIEMAVEVYSRRHATSSEEDELAEARDAVTALQKRIDATVRLQVEAITKGLDPSVYDSTLKEITERKASLVARCRAAEIAQTSRESNPILTQAEMRVAAMSAIDRVIREVHAGGPDRDEVVKKLNELLRGVVSEVVPVDEEEGVKIALRQTPGSENDYTILIV